MPGLLADLVLALHFLIVAFVLLGQLAIIVGWLRHWRWVRRFWFRLLHLATIVFVAAQAWLRQLCPLTVWEQQLRKAAGQGFHSQSFVEYWLSRILFYDLPWWVFVTAYTLFAAAVLLTWWKVPPVRHRAD